MATPPVTKVIRPGYLWARSAFDNALFDRRYGVDTDGDIPLTELGIAGADRIGYKPTKLLSLRRALPPREVSDRDVFLDYGSGKGRVVLQAALCYPFRRVYGVELSARLNEIATRNVEVVRDRLRCTDVRLVRADAREYDLPDDVTAVFLYNPFQGEVFEAVVRRLLDSLDRRPRPLRVVYGNPLEEAALLRTGRFRQVRTVRGWRPGREWSRSNSLRLYTAV